MYRAARTKGDTTEQHVRAGSFTLLADSAATNDNDVMTELLVTRHNCAFDQRAF